MEENPIYKFMRDNDLTQLDEKSFLDKYSDPNEALKIHKFMVDNNLTETPSTDFYNQYFKKKEAAVSPSSAGQLPSQETESVAYGPMGAIGLQRTKDYKPSEIFEGRSAGDVGWEMGKIFAKGTLGFVSQTLMETPAILTAATVNALSNTGLVDPIEASDVSIPIGPSSAKLMDASREYKNMIDSLIPTDKEVEKDFWGQVSRSMGEMVPVVLSGFVGGGAKAIGAEAVKKGAVLENIVKYGKDVVSRLSSPQGVITMSQVLAPSYEQAKSEGATENQALTYAIQNALVSFPIEMLPVDNLFKRLDKVMPGNTGVEILKRGVVGGSEEFITEGFQNMYENVSANFIYGTTKDILDGVGEAAAVGGTVGFLMNTLLTTLVGKRSRATSQEEKDQIDKSISEVEQKVGKVEENNSTIQQTVSELEKVSKSKVRTINDGSQNLDFLELEDGSIEYSEDGLSEPTAIAMTGVLNMRYPNMEFSVKNNTGSGPFSAADFTITGKPKAAKQEAVVEQPAISEEPVAEQALTPKIQDMAGESVTVRIGNRNVSGIVEVDEGGKATITEGNRVYEIPEGTQFSEFTRPVSISPEGDFVVNGDSFSEARVVTEDGQKKALMIREDGTTKAITNPRVVEEIEYNIAMASVDQMTDEEADQTIAQYEQQRQAERPAEAGTDQATPESEEDRKLREATEEIDLIEQLALMELEDVESQAKLVEFTPKTMKTPSTYLVKKNPDGSYSATLNGRKVARPEIVAELGKAFEAQTGQDVAKLQEQTNRLKQEVEQKLFGRGDQNQQQAAQPGGTQPAAPEAIQPQPTDQGTATEIPVEKTELAKRIRGNKIKGALSSIDFGISVGLYNSALEFMAKQVERGSKIGDAITATVKWIDGQVDKNWNKDQFSKYVNSSLRLGPERKRKAQLPKKVADRLTEDEDGNVVFHHYSFSRRNKIKPTDGTGSQLVSKEEARALSSVGGVAQYYVQEGQVEAGTGPVLHTVKVPKEKVYYLQEDPLNFYDEAKARFEEVRPGQAFGPNEQAAWIGKVANENGFDMLVSEWRTNELRAQTTLELSPLKQNTSMKPKQGAQYNVGDVVDYSGTQGTVTNVDGDMLTIESKSQYGGNPIVNRVNLARSARFVKKISDAKASDKKAKAIAAPFYNTQVKNVEDAAKLRLDPKYKAHLDVIQRVADLFGVKINQLEDTIGGYENEDGEKIVELSTVIDVADDTDLDKLEEMAAVLASLAPEVQESTIAGRYVEQTDPGYLSDNGIDEFVVSVGDMQGALDALKAAEIFNFTLNETEGTVTLLDFSKGEDLDIKEKLTRFVYELKQRNISYGQEQKHSAESRFIGLERRREILGRLQEEAVNDPERQEEFSNIISEAIKRDNSFRKKKGYPLIKAPGKARVKELQKEAIKKLKAQSKVDLSDSDFIEKTEEIAKSTEFMVVPSEVTPGWVFNTKTTSFEGDITMENVKKASPDSYTNTALRLNAHPVFSLTKAADFLKEYAKVPKYIQKLDLADIKADIKLSREKKSVKDPGKNATQKKLDEYREKVEFRIEASDLLRLTSFEEIINTMASSRNPYTMSLYAAIDSKFVSKRQVSIDKKAAEKARDRFERGIGTKDKLIQSFVRKKTKEEVGAQAEAIYQKAFEVAKGNIRFVFDLIAEPMRNLSKLWYDGANIISNAFSEEYGVTIEQSSAMIAALSPQMAWMSNLHLAQSVMQVMSDGNATVTQEIVDRFDLTSREYPDQRSYLPVFRKLIGENISNLSDKDAAILIRAYYELYMNPYAPLRIPSGTIVGAETGITSFNSYTGIEKAVSVFRDGSAQNISDQLGEANKIRNFYNNISNPQDNVSITNDTHAMAVAYMLPLAASSSEVKFGPGEYSFFADAYRAVAEEVGMLPREVQSITWEGIRGLFTESFKTSSKSDGPRKVMDRYAAGEITIDEARNEILTLGVDANKTEWSEHLAPWIKGEIEDKFIRRIPDSRNDQNAGVAGRGEPVPGVLPGVGGRVDAGDGQQASGIEAQKAKVDALAKSLKDQVNNQNMGIAVDFRAKAQEDIKFFNTLGSLVSEYAKLKGMEFKQFISEIEKLFNSKMSADNVKFLAELWEEAVSGQKRKPAPSVNKILGTPKKKVTVDEAAALKSQIRLEARAAREAKLDLNTKRRNISVLIKSMVSKGKITARQANALLNRMNSLNLDSEVMVGRFLDYAERVFKDAEYADKLSTARSARKQIKSLSRNKDKAANLRDVGSKFADIDPALVDDIDQYNELASLVKESIKGSSRRGDSVKIARVFRESKLMEYVNEELDIQNKLLLKLKAMAVQEATGVDTEGMTYDELMSILDKPEDLSDEKEKLAKASAERAFDVLSAIADGSIVTGIDPYTGEEVSYTEKQKKVVNDFMSMDLNLLSVKQALEAVDALMNFIQNKSIAKMEATYNKYLGEANMLIAESKNIKTKPIRKFWSPRLGKLLIEQTANLNILFERIFSGFARGGLMEELTGVTDLKNGKSKANSEANKIVQEYVDMFYKKKPNGQEFNTAFNDIERGMVAYMMRNLIGDEAKMKTEFKRRKLVVEESISMLSEGSKKEKEKAEEYRKVYDKILKDSDDSASVSSKADPINVEAVEFWQEKWADKYQELYDVALGVYNKVLEKDINYNPDKYSKLESSQKPDELTNEEMAFLFNSGGNFLYKKESGNLMSMKRPDARQVRKADRYINLSFDSNNSGSMYDALVDVRTAAAIRKVESAIYSKAFKRIVSDNDDLKLLQRRIQLYVNNIRNKNPFSNDEFSKFAKGLNRIAAIGVGQSLGGFLQPIKQTMPIAMNTLINAGDLDLSAVYNESKKKFIDNSGYAIANRGVESLSQIQSLNKMIDEAAKSAPEKAFKAIEKVNEWWLKKFLVNFDSGIARASWLTYYEQHLKKKGVDVKLIDYDTHKLDPEAADYAQRQVDRQQNVSDSDLAGELLSSKDASKQIFMKVMMPFASFRMNQSARLGADVDVLTSKISTKEDKVIAARSLAGFTIEMVTFRALSAMSALLTGYAVKAIMGGEEDEEKDQKKKDAILKGQLTSTVADLLSPMPLADRAVQLGVNNILQSAQDALDIEEKKRLSLYTGGSLDLFKDLGILGIPADRASQLGEIIWLSADGSFKDAYGRTKQVSDEDQGTLGMMVPFAIMSNIGLAPSEVNSIVRSTVNEAKRNASTTKKDKKGKGETIIL
jgi:hypothetical protein